MVQNPKPFYRNEIFFLRLKNTKYTTPPPPKPTNKFDNNFVDVREAILSKQWYFLSLNQNVCKGEQ